MASNRDSAQREADLVVVAEMLSKGATEREIAEAIGVSPSTAHADMKLVERRWQKRAFEKIDLWKGRLIAGHERTMREAWEEWERSKLDAERHVETTALPPRPKGDDLADADTVYPDVLVLTQRVSTTEGRTGDPRYLTAITNASAEIAKVLGVNAPVKAELTGPVPVQVIEIVAPAESTGG